MSSPLLCYSGWYVCKHQLVGWLVVLGLTILWDSISVYIGSSPKDGGGGGERKEKWQMRVKMSKQSPPAPTASAVGPCPTLIQISRTPRHWKFTQHHRTTRPPPCKHQLENVNTDDKSDKSNVSGNLNFRFGSPSLLLNRKLSKYTRQTNKKKKKKRIQWRVSLYWTWNKYFGHYDSVV